MLDYQIYLSLLYLIKCGICTKQEIELLSCDLTGFHWPSMKKVIINQKKKKRKKERKNKRKKRKKEKKKKKKRKKKKRKKEKNKGWKKKSINDRVCGYVKTHNIILFPQKCIRPELIRLCCACFLIKGDGVFPELKEKL